jgi:protein gp37
MTVTRSKIEWTDSTWNPATGCQPVSPGCENCYAKVMTERFSGPGSFDRVELHPDRLGDPQRWRKARRVFVNSMGELFHSDVPSAYVAAVWCAMHWTSNEVRGGLHFGATRPVHTYQILTKRHTRMRSWVRQWGVRDTRVAMVEEAAQRGWCDQEDVREAPFMRPVLDNVWLGVSVEDQARALLRIPTLEDTPAVMRFLSCEPLLGPVDLSQWLCACGGRQWVDDQTWVPETPEAARKPGAGRIPCGFCNEGGWGQPDVPRGLGWVIAGGESGRNARPMHPDWARKLRNQCAATGVPFHFKQWGAWAPVAGAEHWQNRRETDWEIRGDGVCWTLGDPCPDPLDGSEVLVRRVGKTAAGRVLDGQTWDQFPG